jgi:hypothetical protein
MSVAVRKLLSLLIISALVLLPLAGALDRAEARASAAMSDCDHGAAPAKAAPDHCPKCGDNTCAADCVLKCMQLAAIVAPIADAFLVTHRGVAPAATSCVRGRAPAPPAPPPRA